MSQHKTLQGLGLARSYPGQGLGPSAVPKHVATLSQTLMSEALVSKSKLYQPLPLVSCYVMKESRALLKEMGPYFSSLLVYMVMPMDAI